MIVESPAKAKTIKGYLGPGYVVEASVGHIRDLPERRRRGARRSTPARSRRLGVDVEHDFQPIYVVNADKKAQVRKLKELLAESDELFLATDEDREGEAIAWHLQEVLKPKVPVHRMVFHEITKDAIQRRRRQPARAQPAHGRRPGDPPHPRPPLRLRGLAGPVEEGHAAAVGRPCPVRRHPARRRAGARAHRLPLRRVLGPDRHLRHRPRRGRLRPLARSVARLNTVDGRRVAQGRDFGSDGQLKNATRCCTWTRRTPARSPPPWRTRTFAVRSVESKPYRRSPYAPFRTTTLQQEASRKLGFGAKATMQVAQKLYENGFITYMRTDSTTLSDTAVVGGPRAGHAAVRRRLPAGQAARLRGKVKNAQEAHEAIRPSGDRFRTPAETGLTGDQFRLYELIWKRTVASQMKDAVGNSVTVKIGGRASDGRDAEFSASGKTITFHGFLKAYVEGADDPNAELDDRERRLPQVAEGDALTAEEISVDGHATKPPARYTEASLVKELEEREIGRPSTYASIIGTILDRGYVFKKGTALVPSFLASPWSTCWRSTSAGSSTTTSPPRWRTTSTASRAGEAAVRAVAEALLLRRGRRRRGAGLAADAGNGDGDHLGGLKELVTDLGAIDAREISSFPVGEGIMLRVGRYGPYVERGEKDAGGPPARRRPGGPGAGRADRRVAEELLAKPSGDFELGTDPATGTRSSRRTAATARTSPRCCPRAPRRPARTRSSRAPPRCFKSMSLDTVTLEDALKLMSLPRVVGTDAEGVEITAQNGRYGPYLKKGTDSRSLETEDQLFTITLDEALAIYAQPKQRGPGRGQAAAEGAGHRPGQRAAGGGQGRPLRPVRHRRRDQRDAARGTTTSRRSRRSAGYELLAEKRAKGPAKKTAKKAPAKKAPAKKTAAKKTAAKKTAAKKTDREEDDHGEEDGRQEDAPRRRPRGRSAASDE